MLRHLPARYRTSLRLKIMVPVVAIIVMVVAALAVAAAVLVRDVYMHVVLLISAGILLFAALSADHVITRFLRPVMALSAGMQRISEGHLQYRIEIDRDDEIGAMAARFNGMAERLHASQAQIRQHARLLEQMVDERTRELREAYDELQTLDLAKDGFLSSVSHEMRTPLTSILAAVEILEEFADNDPGARREFLSIIHREANRMLSLVVDVLDLAKFEARTMQLEWTDVELCGLVSGVVEAMHASATDANVVLALRHPPPPMRCPCDADRIRRVVRSLVHNAIKFSPRGAQVDVELSRSGVWARVAVRDRGPGIREEERDRIFGLFAKPIGERGRPAGGIGLGLPIGMKIVRLHGGDLRHEDPGDGGSRFVLTLPLTRRAPSGAARQAAPPGTGRQAAGAGSAPPPGAAR